MYSSNSISSFLLFQRVLNIFLMCTFHRRGKLRKSLDPFLGFVILNSPSLLVGGLWFGLRASCCKSRHSAPWATPTAHGAVLILRWGLPDSLGVLVWKLNPVDLRPQPFQQLGLQGYATRAWPLNFLMIAILFWMLEVCCLLQYIHKANLLELRISSSHCRLSACGLWLYS
jgi:hypothetical protein